MSLPSAKSAYLGWLARALEPERSPLAPISGPVVGDVVLGYGTGYDAADIAPFVLSLRAVFDGAVALVVDDRADLKAFLAEHGVIAVHPQHLDGWEPHAVMARFAAFDRLLGQWPEAKSVLITDVRDVIFQAEPFSPVPERLETYVEFEDGVLRDHDFNMKYLRAVGGDDLAEAVADKPCVCVGTVMGPRYAMIRFCRTVMMLAAIPRSELGGAFGADQAACNLAIHMGLVEADIRPNYGRVATLGLTKPESLGWSDGRVINPDGGWSAIVHQHDRHPTLATAVHARWGGGLEHRERVQKKTAAQRFEKQKRSIRRRLPELR
ncbi:MAG TPA: hypothetical protein VF633_05020 [Brevundimonas sp.]